LVFSAPVIVTVAEPLVAFPTPTISPNAEYCEVKLVEFSQVDDCEVLGGEKSVVG
jgi:hypothetical protein